MSPENTQKKSIERQDGIDEREAVVIREARFFEPYKKELKQLFTALNREEEWSDNPGDMLSYMQRRWIGQEHGDSFDKDKFSEDETAAALDILEKMNFTGELLPPPNAVFDQTIIVGGFTTANYRREKFLVDAAGQGTDLGTQIWLVGQRPRDTRDGTDEELLGSEGRFSGYDLSDNPWARHAKKIIGESNGDGSDDKWAFTETDTARIALLKVKDPDLKPNRIDLNITAVNGRPYGSYEPVEDAPYRDITDYQFETKEGEEIILLNAAAVERGSGPSRHTTASATAEWLERHTPPHGAKVLYVTGNPHSLRTTQDTYKILHDMNRGDIELVMAGTTPAVGTVIQVYLGEIARLIDNDWKRNYQQTEQV